MPIPPPTTRTVGSGSFKYGYISDADDGVIIYAFDGPQLAMVWHREYTRIKHAAELVNENFTQQQPERFVAWQQWVHLYNIFKSNWGAEYIPPDIKRARDDVVTNGLIPHGYTVPE